MVYRIIIFLALNFIALAIGSMFTGDGVPSEWYQQLNKAPWTPPGWVFGAAWTLIMICFAFYMSSAWKHAKNRTLLVSLFVVQWILNIAWNPIFFNYHEILLALIVISSLTGLIGFFLKYYYPNLKNKSLLLLPYFIWLLIATSLNAYILFNN